jgi:photosystem II stability/assembly factor-like uncharacterized protein
MAMVPRLALAADPEDTNASEEADDGKLLSAKTFAGLKLRGIGPAMASGRICDFAVNPNNRAEYYAAVCSGGVWKTDNAGTTWKPIFDTQGSYSIGCITMDPKNPHVIWVGAGENNSQRSVSFGDGVYRSRDGGKSWENLGLKQSEHIGNILIDPRDSNVVFVAAQGPLWRSGGDRGLYKTSDGGKTWQRSLHISDDTGVNEVHMDPRDPNVLYASAYQRRRHVWTLVNGGPESAVYKSTDAGATWRKITSGVPDVDKGRIGMCVSPVNPDVVYAIIEAQYDKGGFFRSTDRGETWERRSTYMATSPQYYNEIVCDPVNVDRVYTLDTFMHVSDDGGKTFKRAPREDRHVDDHALWIDPHFPDYLLIGCDGGVYESFDRGENWNFKANLPITQFYRVAVDNSLPFYYVYGGTQDNNTMGGPSRTINPAGIPNELWFVTVGGDGFEPQIDPEDPNIVYSQWQHGGLVRHDRRSGEVVDIKPREKPGDDPYRWNWDSPLLISPHNHERLYFCCQRVFRSDDRGDSWTAISDDLTRGLDRHKLKVFGRVQSADAVARHKSTSIYGNIVSFSESPVVADLLYVGTDDGLIQISENGGTSWRKEEVFPSVPDITYVSGLTASRHDGDTVYAAFDNHKNGDFKPYILKSTDRGQSWKSVSGDLPERETVYSVQEDHVNPNLLFAGTEFGIYFTYDAGEHWIRLKGGIPTIAVRDVDIQRRENDLVLATFGRSFYVLDDYTPLRSIDEELLKKDAVLFPVKDALHYIESSPLGNRSGRGWQGAAYYAAPNPPFGATFTYYLKEKLQSRRERRQEAEKKTIKAGKEVKIPTIEEHRAEDEEKEPQILLIVRDPDGAIVRRKTASREKGIHRASWELRYPSTEPTRVTKPEDLPPWAQDPVGPLAAPGKYTVTLAKEVDGEMTELSEPQTFNVVALDTATFAAKNKDEVLEFRLKVARLQRSVRGALRFAGEVDSRVKHLRKAFIDTPGADPKLLSELDALDKRLTDAQTALRGDRTLAEREEPTPPSINERVMNIVGGQWYVTSAPTQTQRDQFGFAVDEFRELLDGLKKLTEDLVALEVRFDDAGAPWTPGRLPTWENE